MTRDQLAVSADYIAKVLTEAPPLTDQQPTSSPSCCGPHAAPIECTAGQSHEPA